MKLRELTLKENETLISTHGQEPHNFTARAQVGQGIEWPKASGTSDSVNVKRDEVEMPGEHHNVGHHDEGHGDGVSESIVKEFAPVGGDDREPDEEEILRQLASMWWLGTEQQMAKAQRTLASMGWEIGQDESGDDDAGVFLVRPGDVNGDTYIAFNHSDLELSESWVMEDGEATVSADIATVAYPMTRGRNRREKRRAARAAVGQRYTPGPAGVGKGVYETSLATMRDYFAGNDDAQDPTELAKMRDYFNKIDKDVPETIQRIIWKVKNNVSLKPLEFSQYKTWMNNRRKMKEAHVLDHKNVIYRLDKDKPMTDTEVLVLGGAGRYTLGGLREKARREADAMAADLKVEHGGSFRRAAENIKQLTNTLNTIVAAYNELKRIRSKGGRGSRGITDEETNFMRECTQRMNTLELYTNRVRQAQRIVEGIHYYLKEDKMSHEQASIIKGMFHLKTDPGYGFYRYAIHVAGDHGGDKVVLGPNAGPFAYAYTQEEEKMIRDAVKAITGSEPIELTGGKSEEPDFVNKNSTVPSIDWKKVK